MPDDRLGMHEPISRRDFLNGTLLASAGLVLGRPFQAPATRSPAEAWNGYGGVGDYARAHGNMYDVMTTAHRLRDGAFDRAIANAIDTGEMYDLVAVGGGLSTLAAVVFLQQQRARVTRLPVTLYYGLFGSVVNQDMLKVVRGHRRGH